MNTTAYHPRPEVAQWVRRLYRMLEEPTFLAVCWMAEHRRAVGDDSFLASLLDSYVAGRWSPPPATPYERHEALQQRLVGLGIPNAWYDDQASAVSTLWDRVAFREGEQADLTDATATTLLMSLGAAKLALSDWAINHSDRADHRAWVALVAWSLVDLDSQEHIANAAH